MSILSRMVVVGLGLILGFNASAVQADEFYLADGQGWPGRILRTQGTNVEPLLVRPAQLPDDGVPRVQSLTTLADGRVIFCSGLDRALFELAPRGERRFHHGGYLARQVRTAADGTLYWSGLETPLGNNPLPDGFIYACNPATGVISDTRTFSQGDVGNDWWGAFDVRDGRIIVGTLRDRTTLYDVTASPVTRVATLPIALTAFRFAPDGSLYGCDGRGKLYRFADLAHPEQYETVLQLPTPFVDFAWAPNSR